MFCVLQVEGLKSPEGMLTILQKVLEESSPVLVAARLDAEERRNNVRLREEQDAAYRAALEADQVCNSFNLAFLLVLWFYFGPGGMFLFPSPYWQTVTFQKKNIPPFKALSYCYSLLLQARERQRREEQERREREAAEAERMRKEEEEACERAAREAEEKEAALAKMRQEKALSLGAEPEKGPNVTQVLTRTFLFFMLFLCC